MQTVVVMAASGQSRLFVCVVVNTLILIVYFILTSDMVNIYDILYESVPVANVAYARTYNHGRNGGPSCDGVTVPSPSRSTQNINIDHGTEPWENKNTSVNNTNKFWENQDISQFSTAKSWKNKDNSKYNTTEVWKNEDKSINNTTQVWTKKDKSKYTTEHLDHSSFNNSSKLPVETRQIIDRCDDYIHSNYTTPLHYNKHLDQLLLDRCLQIQRSSPAPGTHWNIKYNEMRVKTRCGEVIAEPVTTYNITAYTQDKLSVPNIVHYVTFGSGEFSFLNFLSVLSVHKFVRPAAIFIHGERPHGTWWNRSLQDITNLYFVPYAQPQYIQGRKIEMIQHTSDIIRLGILRGQL